MKILIADDDFISRQILKDIMKQFGECDVVVDGDEAVQAFRLAWEENDHYDLIFMDIMMPRMDGTQALKQIRAIEKENKIKGPDEVKVIMTTALNDPKTVIEAFYESRASSYILKPLTEDKIVEQMKSFGLI